MSLPRLHSLADLGKPKKPRTRKKGTSAVPLPLEKEVQRNVVAYLRAIGATVVRVNSGTVVFPATATHARRALHGNLTPGCSDLLVCLPASGEQPAGRFAGIEIKRKGGKATPKQLAFLGDVQRSGGIALVCDGVDDLREKLRLEGYELP